MYIRHGTRLKPFINFIADKNLAMALGTAWKDTPLYSIMYYFYHSANILIKFTTGHNPYIYCAGPKTIVNRYKSSFNYILHTYELP